MNDKEKVKIPASIEDWRPLTDDQLNDLAYDDILFQVAVASKMLMLQGRELAAVEKEWRELGVKYYVARTQSAWLRDYVACVKQIERTLAKL